MEIAERYLELALRLGRHLDGLVDSYYGPSELAERVGGEEPPSTRELVRDAATLIDELERDDELDRQRRRWLLAQLIACHTVASRLAGESFDYVTEVELCFDVKPRRLPPARLVAMHRALDEALPGRGELASRYQEWLATLAVPADKLLGALESLAVDFRERSECRFGLPPGAAVEFELVSGKPWGASNTYLGGCKSHLAFNTDVGFDAPLLAQLVAHELFPGHLTERSIKEHLLVRGRGWLEETLAIGTGPRVAIGEGIAETAFDVLLGDEAHNVAGEHFRAVGLDYDAHSVRAVWRAMAVGEQFDILSHAALMLHVDGATRDEAHEFISRWSLLPAARVEVMLDFVTHPTWRTTAACYSEGRRLVTRFVGRDDARFRRLLSEQLLPADLDEPNASRISAVTR